jgi:hypothetical protein
MCPPRWWCRRRTHRTSWPKNSRFCPPWGLEDCASALAPLGYNAPQNAEDRFKTARLRFNGGSERETGLGLHWDCASADETPFRPYDAQLGRFHGVDLLAEIMPSWTPMHFGFNDPISQNDPTGLSPQPPKNTWRKFRAIVTYFFTGRKHIMVRENGTITRWIHPRFGSGGKPKPAPQPDNQSTQSGGSSPVRTDPVEQTGLKLLPGSLPQGRIDPQPYRVPVPEISEEVTMSNRRLWNPGAQYISSTNPFVPWEANSTSPPIPGGPFQPLLTRGDDQLQRIVDYLVAARGLGQQPNTIEIQGISTSFAGGRQPYPGLGLVVDVRAILMQRLRAVRQILEFLYVDNQLFNIFFFKLYNEHVI